MHEIKVDFKIFGIEYNLEEISERLELPPTKFLKKGEPISKNSQKARTENIWILESFSKSQLSLEDHIQDIVQQLKPLYHNFKDICNKYYSEFSCVLVLECNSEESIPSIHIDNELLWFISGLNSNIDIDIYTKAI